jgi:hypothetical protein
MDEEDEEQRGAEPISVRLIQEPKGEKTLPLLAVLISTLAVALSSYIAYLSHQHNKLSVAPLITAWHEPHPSKPEVTWKVVNAGLGPAKITDIALFVKGRRGEGSIANGAHWRELQSLADVKLKVNRGRLLVPGEGFRMGDEIQPFSLAWSTVGALEKIRSAPQSVPPSGFMRPAGAGGSRWLAGP